MEPDVVVAANRCTADLDRRKRALQDCGLTQRVRDMERRVEFEVGYDHRAFPHDCGGGGHGQHGMTIHFTLIGPKGATAWSVNLMNWVPGSVQHGRIKPTGDVSAYIPAHESASDAYAGALGVHATEPMFGDSIRRTCTYLPEGYCYYDAGYLNGEPILEAFVQHGPHAVWAALARHYGDTFTSPGRVDL